MQKWPVSRLLQTLVNPRHIVQRWWSMKRLPTCVACLTFSLFYLVCRDFAQHPKDDGLLDHGGFLLLLGAERREVLGTTAQFCMKQLRIWWILSPGSSRYWKTRRTWGLGWDLVWLWCCQVKSRLFLRLIREESSHTNLYVRFPSAIWWFICCYISRLRSDLWYAI